ncbi:hypothetical protein GCM10010464_54100 [Pseudonocardia yunnanensis]|uniref:Uncharacterized protein n=1 Tax=Pseudonocardia yunnanensis TaxID=58107 RepID=A0ABW4F8A0_9PSEU
MGTTKRDAADSASAATSVIDRTTNGKPVVEPPVLGGPEHTDYFLLDDLLTDEKRALRLRVREFRDREVLPIINPYWERAEFPHEPVSSPATEGTAAHRHQSPRP